MNSKSRTLSLEALESRQMYAAAANPIVSGGGFSPASWQNLSGGGGGGGEIINMVLQTGPVLTVDSVNSGTTASPIFTITRVSFIDPHDNIDFAEFSGPGTLTVTLLGAQPRTSAVNYNQPGIYYVKGLAYFNIVGATSATNFSVFSLGNDPTRVNQAIVVPNPTFDGVADVQLLTITPASGSTTGINFGTINMADAQFTGLSGEVGIDAPLIGATGSPGVMIGDIRADGSAIPELLLSTSSYSGVLEAGGSLAQGNASYLNVQGVSSITMTSSTTSYTPPGAMTAIILPAQDVGAPLISKLYTYTNGASANNIDISRVVTGLPPSVTNPADTSTLIPNIVGKTIVNIQASNQTGFLKNGGAVGDILTLNPNGTGTYYNPSVGFITAPYSISYTAPAPASSTGIIAPTGIDIIMQTQTFGFEFQMAYIGLNNGQYAVSISNFTNNTSGSESGLFNSV